MAVSATFEHSWEISLGPISEVPNRQIDLLHPKREARLLEARCNAMACRSAVEKQPFLLSPTGWQRVQVEQAFGVYIGMLFAIKKLLDQLR